MKITKFGHSCLLVEEGEGRFLTDPGSFSQGFDQLQDLTAILITHQHGDHFDRERVLALVKNNPGVQIICDQGTAEQLDNTGVQVKTVKAGDRLELAGVPVAVFGERHAVIHPDLPNVPNVGFLIGGRLFHPGDAFTDPKEAVEVLGLPVSAPWAKLEEVIDYVRQIKPKVAVPIHEKVSASPEMLYGMLGKVLGEVEFIALKDGETREL